jgi:hypothetical protein
MVEARSFGFSLNRLHLSPVLNSSLGRPSSTFIYLSLPSFRPPFFFLMFIPSLLAALGLAIPSALAQQAGSFVAAGDTLVSAMMVCRQHALLRPTLNTFRCLWAAQTKCTSSIKWRVMLIKSTVIPLTHPCGQPIFSYVFHIPV